MKLTAPDHRKQIHAAHTGAMTFPTTVGNSGSIIFPDNAYNGTQSIALSSTATTILQVTSVSPAGDQNTGRNYIQIYGTLFIGATNVTIGTQGATYFKVVSDTQIIAVPPAGTTGSTVDITFITPSGTSPIWPGDKYTFYANANTLALSVPNAHTGTRPSRSRQAPARQVLSFTRSSAVRQRSPAIWLRSMPALPDASSFKQIRLVTAPTPRPRSRPASP